ncbi:hypothetical protein WA026_021056 [Henosepilachna vigintioctopunctata]|uniref:Uncharacterized protein n=1 Tax=Henosepilachna vigintioctopunctata TaxID=420089 RepID=A0AAW1UWL8_9CUCU
MIQFLRPTCPRQLLKVKKEKTQEKDVGIVDQAAICVRYVKTGIPQKRMLSMVPVRKSTGEDYRALRTSLWVEKTSELTAGQDKLRPLQNFGKTRWWAKDKAVITIMEKTGYVALIKTLSAISSSTEFEPKVSFQAKALKDSF